MMEMRTTKFVKLLSSAAVCLSVVACNGAAREESIEVKNADAKAIEISSPGGKVVECFKLPQGVTFEVLEKRQLLIRFNNFEDLFSQVPPTSYGERLLTIAAYENEGQKIGSAAFAGRQLHQSEIGNFLVFTPKSKADTQILMIQKDGLLGIRYFPTTSDLRIGVASNQIPLLVKFIDEIHEPCRSTAR